jgi:hypothetical protein
MAKSKKKKSAEKTPHASENDPLHEAVDTFARGDYAKARVLLEQKAHDASLSEGQREEAEELFGATGIERGTLWVGLACIALLALVVIVTTLTQPH